MEVHQFSSILDMLAVKCRSVHAIISRVMGWHYYDFWIDSLCILQIHIHKYYISGTITRLRKVMSIKLDNFIHENKPGLCLLGIIFGIPMIVLSSLSLAFSEGNIDMFQWANDLIGNWGFWVILLGFFLLVPGAYYLAVFVKQVREFNRLMETDSKQMFIKNQDRIEELAWRLHPKYEKLVIEKKLKLKVK